MGQQTYLNFDLLFLQDGDSYQVQVVNSPSGEARGSFQAPFSALDLSGIEEALERARRGRGDPELIPNLGHKLFEAAFTGEVRECLHRSLDMAQHEGKDLRIRLRLSETPELARWPWEYLYDSSKARYLALTTETPIARYMDLAEPTPPLAAHLPLNILVILSAPNDQVKLALEHEWDLLQDALASLQAAGRVSLIRLETATLSALRKALREQPIHMLHYLGHGTFLEGSDDGVLLFEKPDGSSESISGEALAMALHNHDTLRVVVMNACEGTHGSSGEAFKGVAQTLAMQYEISDPAAVTFGQEFYSALADGSPIDAAVSEGRKAIYAAGNTVEWGTPVLYHRAADGQIFDLPGEDAMTDQPNEEQARGGISIQVGGNVTGNINAAERDIIIQNQQVLELSATLLARLGWQLAGVLA